MCRALFVDAASFVVSRVLVFATFGVVGVVLGSSSWCPTFSSFVFMAVFSFSM